MLGILIVLPIAASNCFGQAVVYPDSGSMAPTKLVKPGQVFYNTSDYVYHAVVDDRLREARTILRVDASERSEVKKLSFKNKLLGYVVRFGIPIAFAGGVVVGVLVTK